MAKSVEFALEVNLAKFERTMKTAARTSQQADDTMRKVVKTGKAIETQLNKIDGKVKVDVTADTSALDRAESKVVAIDGMTPKVTLQTDVDDLDKAEAKIEVIDGATPAVTVQTNTASLDRAGGKLSSIEGATPDVTVQTDASTLDTADAKIGEIEGATPEVDVQVDSSKIDALAQQIASLNTTATLTLVIQGADFLRGGGFGNIPVIGDIGQMTQAVREYETLTGEINAATRGIISDEFSRGLAESPQQVAAIAAGLTNAKVPADQLGAALETVFNAAAFSKRDPAEVMEELKQSVATGVADNIIEAGDAFVVMTRTVAEGGDAVAEFGRKFAEMGNDAAQVASFFGQGTALGIEPGRLGEIVNVLDVSLAQAATALGKGETTEQLDALALLGLDTSPEAIAGYSSDALGFMKTVVDSVNAEIASGTLSQGAGNDLMTLILGSPLEEISANAFRDIDFGAALAASIQPGALDEAIAPLFNSVPTAIEELGRVIQAELGESFRLAGVPLQEFIDGLPEKIRELSDLIRSGEGIPEALEIVLEAPGLADKIRDLEAGMGRFIIEFLNGIAMIVDAIPGGNAEPLRGTVADLAAGQLEYELRFADGGAEIEAAVTNAINRGVTEADVQAAVSNVVMDLIDESQLIAAQTIIDKVLSMASTTTPTTTSTEVGFSLIGQGASTDITQTTAGLQGLDLSETQAEIDNVRTSLDETNPFLQTAVDTFMAWEEQAHNVTTNIQKMDDPIASVEFGAENVTTAVDTLVDSLSDLEEGGPASIDALALTLEENGPTTISWLEDMTNQMEALREKAALAAVAVESVGNAGGGSGGEFVKTDGSHAGGLPDVPFDGYIAELHAGEAVLTAPEANVWRSLFADIPTSSGGSSVINNTTNIVNVNTNIQSHGAAQLMGNAGRVARSIRGF